MQVRKYNINSQALRDEFTYKPKITREQFFAKGFAERKCLFVCDVIRLCKTLHHNLTRESKLTTSDNSASKKRNPLAQIDILATGSKGAPVRLTQSSPIRDTLKSTFSDSAPSPRLLPSSSIAPPSKYLADHFWRESIQTLNPIIPSPPQPIEKNSLLEQSADDSLLHYHPEEFSSAASNIANPSSRYPPYISSDMTSISDAGKPEVEQFMTVADFYAESLASGQPQTRHYHTNGSNISDRRTPSPFQNSFSESGSPSRSRTPTRTSYEFLKPPLYSRSPSPTKSGSFIVDTKTTRSDSSARETRTEPAQSKEGAIIEKYSPSNVELKPKTQSPEPKLPLQSSSNLEYDLQQSRKEQRILISVFLKTLIYRNCPQYAIV